MTSPTRVGAPLLPFQLARYGVGLHAPTVPRRSGGLREIPGRGPILAKCIPVDDLLARGTAQEDAGGQNATALK